MNFFEKAKYFLKKYKISLLVAIFYTATAFFVCYFLLKDIAHTLIPGDGLFTYWTMGWDIHSFLHNPGNLFNANIFYPNPITLTYSEGLFAPAFIALPFFLILRNMIVVYNLMIFFSYILSAFGAYKLAKYYTKNSYASFIAGLIFGFSTYRIVSMGHFQNILIFWMPFAALFLQKFLDTKKRKYIVYFALLFSAQMLTSWNMGAFFALFVAFLLIANWKIIRDNFSLFLKDGIIALAIIVILVAPFAYPYFKLYKETHHSYPIEEIINGSGDIGGYIIPPPGTNMTKLSSFLGLEKKHWGENMNFLGYFSILLLLYYFLFSKNRIASRNFKIYALGIPVFIIFSFGPILRFVPSMNIPSLYYLVMPAMGFNRTPARLSIIVLLFVSITIAFVINSMRAKNNVAKKVLFFLVPAFILFEFWVPNSSSSLFTKTSCPAIYTDMKNDTSISAIAEFPVENLSDPSHKKTLEYMYDSTCDNFKPIFNGYSGYAPRNYTKQTEKINTFPDPKSVKFMKSVGISHVLVHLDAIDENQQKPFLEAVQQNDKLKIEHQDGQDYLISLQNNQ